MELKKHKKYAPKYYCEFCDYGTSKTSSYKNHLLSSKHNLATQSTFGNQNYAEMENDVHQCEFCHKIYKDKSGLWKHKHKKLCHIIEDEISPETEPSVHINSHDNLVTIDKDVFMSMMKDNNEIKSLLFKILENGVNNIATTNSYNNNNNKTFNLQVFLNETCKNAMNITEFIDSIQPSLMDLENVGRVGYAEGISNIIINRLNAMEINERPIHCSDTKREVTYIKSDDEWNKELEDKPILLKAIKSIASKNIDNILEWQKANPGCTQSDSRKNDMYLNIVSNSMCGADKEETKKNFGKIISKISKNVSISELK